MCCRAGSTLVLLLIPCAGLLLFAGREVTIRRQPVRRRGADCQQITTADRRRRQLLPTKTGGATSGICPVPPETRNQLGGLPQQWRGLGLRAGVGLFVKGCSSFWNEPSCVLHYFSFFPNGCYFLTKLAWGGDGDGVLSHN